MKKLSLVVVAATTVLSTAGFAADLRGPLNDGPPGYGGLPIAPAGYGGFNWSGLYAGLNVGHGGGQEHFGYGVPSDGLAGTDRQQGNGVVGGGQVGFNQSLGHGFVGGAEVDFDGTSIGNSAILDQPILAARIGNHINYFGTVRGRLGYAFNNVMLYATGGFAYAGVSTSVDAPAFGIADRSSHLHAGYTFGAGAEFAVTGNVMLRAEYLRLQYDFRNAPGALYSLEEKPTENVVRAGLDYKFDLFGPAAPPALIARY